MTRSITKVALLCGLLASSAADAALHWAKSDNGKDINWTDAKAYCAAMGAGWRLPTIDELSTLHDAMAAERPCGAARCRVAAPVKLSGPWLWSGSELQEADARDADELAWGLSLTNGARTQALRPPSIGARALCLNAMRGVS